MRIVARPDEDGRWVLTIYINSGGQLKLIRALAALGPGRHHTHLADILTPVSGDLDIHDADVVFVEGRGDIAHAPPTHFP